MDGLKNIIARRMDAMKAGAAKRRRWSHSTVHELADEISRAFGEPAKFTMYLGIIGKVGEVRARAIYREIVEGKCKDRRKLFFWKCSEIYRAEHPEPTIRAKRPKKAKPAKQLPLI
jgi:hypothetical protein